MVHRHHCYRATRRWLKVKEINVCTRTCSGSLRARMRACATHAQSQTTPSPSEPLNPSSDSGSA
eukprot:9565301-Alexandrium_andersonii.AAC.1